MSIFKLTWVQPDDPKPYTNEYGTTYYYNVAGEYEGQNKSTSIGVKDTAKKPHIGQELAGTFQTVNGKEKFVKDRMGSSGGSQQRLPLDPERQESIEWQSARRDAIEFMKLKATGMSKKEVDEFVTTDNVLLITKKFATVKQPVKHDTPPLPEEDPFTEEGV